MCPVRVDGVNERVIVLGDVGYITGRTTHCENSHLPPTLLLTLSKSSVISRQCTFLQSIASLDDYNIETLLNLPYSADLAP